MERLFIRTTSHSTYSYPKVESYTYDRDFIRIHYIEKVINTKCIAVFPTHNVFQLDIQTIQGGESNGKREN